MKRHKKLTFKIFKYHQSWDHKLSDPRWNIRWLIRSSMPMHIPTIHRGSDLWDKSTLASRPPLWQNQTIISVRMNTFVDLVPITTISGLDQGYLWLIRHVFIASFLHRLIYTRVCSTTSLLFKNPAMQRRQLWLNESVLLQRRDTTPVTSWRLWCRQWGDVMFLSFKIAGFCWCH